MNCLDSNLNLNCDQYYYFPAQIRSRRETGNNRPEEELVTPQVSENLSVWSVGFRIHGKHRSSHIDNFPSQDQRTPSHSSERGRSSSEHFLTDFISAITGTRVTVESQVTTTETVHDNNETNHTIDSLGNVLSQQLQHELLNIVVHSSTFFNTVDDTGKVVITQDNIRSILGNIGTSNTHSNTNIGNFQRRRVVDTVTSHSTELLTTVQGFDHTDLSLWRTTGNNQWQNRQGIDLVFGQIIKLLSGHNHRVDNFLRIVDQVSCHSRSHQEFPKFSIVVIEFSGWIVNNVLFVVFKSLGWRFGGEGQVAQSWIEWFVGIDNVVKPKASKESSFLMMTFLLTIILAPTDMVIVKTTTKEEGIMETATQIAYMATSLLTLNFWEPMTMIAKMTATPNKKMANLESFLDKGVPTLSLETGKDSPVNKASSVSKFKQSKILKSAGIVSPTLTLMMSPGTTNVDEDDKPNNTTRDPILDGKTDNHGNDQDQNHGIERLMDDNLSD
ncbi:hypothetical protein WICPIJ_006261 [Wickerhamomyces pijperi]|uniref:Uncharacterized protein n=1 Tax=Wickerhamomyces pijperi TaxID=599730 RepID=A0A9P8Q278_WICPI|nr:hypothetical protein WICPIJ_006261 [Wickerhamomyces pijperi]